MNGTIISSWSAVGEKLYSGVDPQMVAEEILEIGEEATPRQVVERAMDQDSELHKCFDWDDSSAAEKYRIVQARSVMANIVIRRTPEQKQRNAPEIRVFYKTETGRGYKAAPIVFNRTDEYQSLLNRAISELKTFELKYKKLSELQEIFELIPRIGGETS